MTLHADYMDGTIRDGSAEELIMHELGHTSKGFHETLLPSNFWKTAQRRDRTAVSIYARDNPNREDVSESMSGWWAVFYKRATVEQFNNVMYSMPNRYAALTSYIRKMEDHYGGNTFY